MDPYIATHVFIGRYSKMTLESEPHFDGKALYTELIEQPLNRLFLW